MGGGIKVIGARILFGVAALLAFAGCFGRPKGYAFKLEMLDSLPADIDACRMVKTKLVGFSDLDLELWYEMYCEPALHKAAKNCQLGIFSRWLTAPVEGRLLLKGIGESVENAIRTNACAYSDSLLETVLGATNRNFSATVAEVIERTATEKEGGLDTRGVRLHRASGTALAEADSAEQFRSALTGTLAEAIFPKMPMLHVTVKCISGNVTTGVTRETLIPFVPRTDRLPKKMVLTFSDPGGRNFARMTVYHEYGYVNPKPEDLDGVYCEILTSAFRALKSKAAAPKVRKGFAGFERRFDRVVARWSDGEVAGSPVEEPCVIDGISWRYETKDGETTLVRAADPDSTKGAVIIPSVLGGFPVTRIGPGALEDRDQVMSATIPPGVVDIGNSAFARCRRLSSVTIPASVTNIGYGAFCSCSALESVAVPPGVKEIGAYAFAGCHGLTSVMLPEGVMRIGDSAFKGCGRLTSVMMAPGMEEIGARAFAECPWLVSMKLPEGVKRIGDRAFEGCGRLTAVTIPASVTNIGSGVFQYCSGLMEIRVASGGGNFSSEDGVLFDGSKATLLGFPSGRGGRYVMPSSVTGISPGAFRCCGELESVEIQPGVTNIGRDAFRECGRLMSVTIPSGVKDIGVAAFYECHGLSSVAIPPGVTNIGLFAFYKCRGLKSMMIPASVAKVGTRAFGECRSLRSVTLQSSKTHIGLEAFLHCPLRTVYVGDGELECVRERLKKAGCNVKDVIIKAVGK